MALFQLSAFTVNRWIALLANVGVIGGLVFLAVEIRQNTKVALAGTSNEITNQSLEYFAHGMDNEVIAEALYKRKNGIEISDFEADQLWRHQYFNFRVLQNIYVQYRNGLLERSEWEVYRTIMSSRISNDIIAQAMWRETAGSWNKGFQREVDALIEAPLGEKTKGYN